MNYIFVFKGEVNEDIFRRYALKIIIGNGEEIIRSTSNPLCYETQISKYLAIPTGKPYYCGMCVDYIYYDPKITQTDKESLFLCLRDFGTKDCWDKLIPMSMYTTKDQMKIGLKVRLEEGQEDQLERHLDGAGRAFGNKIRELFDEMNIVKTTKEENHTDQRIGFYVVNEDRMKELLEIEKRLLEYEKRPKSN